MEWMTIPRDKPESANPDFFVAVDQVRQPMRLKKDIVIMRSGMSEIMAKKDMFAARLKQSCSRYDLARSRIMPIS